MKEKQIQFDDLLERFKDSFEVVNKYKTSFLPNYVPESDIIRHGEIAYTFKQFENRVLNLERLKEIEQNENQSIFEPEPIEQGRSFNWFNFTNLYRLLGF